MVSLKSKLSENVFVVNMVEGQKPKSFNAPKGPKSEPKTEEKKEVQKEEKKEEPKPKEPEVEKKVEPPKKEPKLTVPDEKKKKNKEPEKKEVKKETTKEVEKEKPKPEKTSEVKKQETTEHSNDYSGPDGIKGPRSVGMSQSADFGGPEFPFPYYTRQIQELIFINWKNPVVNLKIGETMEAIVKFTIQRSGVITGPYLYQSSGNVVYDLAVRRAVESSSPLPALPPLFSGDTLTVFFKFAYIQYN
jgi:TonB family protein